MVDLDVYADSYNKGAENLKLAMQLWGNEIKFVAYDSNEYGVCKVIDCKNIKNVKADVEKILSALTESLTDVNKLIDYKIDIKEASDILYGANFTKNGK